MEDQHATAQRDAGGAPARVEREVRREPTGAIREARVAQALAQRDRRRVERVARAAPQAAPAGVACGALAERAGTRPPRLSGRALHRHIDAVQSDIIALANRVGERYFYPA